MLGWNVYFFHCIQSLFLYKYMNFRKTLTILLSIACVAVYVIGFLLYERNKYHLDNVELIQNSNQAIIQAQNLHTSIERMISLQRGYLLSHDREIYNAYFDLISYVKNELATLQKLTIHNVPQQILLQAVEKDIRELQQMLESNIQRKHDNPIIRFNSLPNHAAVKFLAEDVRRLVNDFVSSEQKTLALYQEEAKNTDLAYFYILLAISVLSVLVLVIANGLILSLATRHRNISETLSQSEKDLFKMRERFELAIRGTQDGVFDWNVETDGFYFSPRFISMLGYDGLTHFPKTSSEFRALIHPDDLQPAIIRMDECLNGGQDYSATFRIRHKDGSWRWILARGATGAKRGEKSSRIVGVHTDITQQKEAKERLRASNKELEEFTYIASHDLRAPLVNLKGFANEIEFSFAPVKDFVLKHLPQSERNEEEQAIFDAVEQDIPQSIHFINHAVLRMEKLTRAILELSRVGRRRLEFEPLHMHTIIDHCTNTLQHEINAKKIRIDLGELPDITGDSVAIEQVFMNILDNAVKYSDQEKEQSIISISGIQNVSETIFRIQDNGRGIRQEDMHKIFEIFKRAGNNTNIPGEGMGMAYVQALIRRHNGTIWCESELGLGTTFYISIPHYIEKGQANDRKHDAKSYV